MPFSTDRAEIGPVILKQAMMSYELKCLVFTLIWLLGLPCSPLPCPVAPRMGSLLLRTFPLGVQARGTVRIPVHAMILKSESDLLACFVKLLDSHFLLPEYASYVIDFQVIIQVIYLV